VARALAPAKIVRIDSNPKEKGKTVVVEDQALSVAIGKSGQNARLTSKLTGWKITILSQSEDKLRKTQAQAKQSQIKELKGVGAKLAQNLIDSGFDTVEGLAHSAPEALLEIEGIGEKKAAKLIKAAQEFLAEQKEAGSAEEATDQGPDQSDESAPEDK